jgi:2-haloacid dehalogenase
MLDLTQFEYLSFDCYGTLIDWESGILGYLRRLLKAKGCKVEDGDILNLYAQFEPSRQNPYQPYREVLVAVVRDFAAHYGFEVAGAEAQGLAESIRDWQPFPDTVAALRALKTRYKIAILSNIDDDLFALTAPKLGIDLDTVVTAQQVRSYKPSLRNFETLLARLPVSKEHLLHVAESLYHDVVPAHKLGIAAVWVNRRQGRPAAATKLVAAEPDLEVPTVGALSEMALHTAG